MANLFIDGNNGNFNETADPTGNPPADWNVSKDSSCIIEFEEDEPIDGQGSFRFSTKNIFNDDFALALNNDLVAGNLQQGQFFNVVGFSESELESYIVEMRFYSNGVSGSQIYDLFSGIGYASRCLFDTDEIAFKTKYTELLTNNLVASFIPNQWNHIVLYLDEINSVKRIYINGLKEAESITNVNVYNKNTFETFKMLLSGDASSINANGYLRGLRFFTGHELTDLEVNQLFNTDSKDIQPIPASMLASLKYECKMNQEQGRSVIEKGGNNFTLNPLIGGFTDEDVAFGGGAWEDVTAIV